MKIATVSYTAIDAGGGVPKWNRDFASVFDNVRHFCWDDVKKVYGDQNIPEWEKARVLGAFIKKTNLVDSSWLFVVDGFWGIGLDWHQNVLSVAHGNWSHTTKDDVDKGILPEFPQHAAVQLDFRKRHLKSGKKIVAVSDFIADQCKLQWGFDFPVINNGIDLQHCCPAFRKFERPKPIIIHGTTTVNKGFDHIDAIKKNVDADVMLLDEAVSRFNSTKYEALAQADLVVHPSAHEGNSYFVMETLACGIPIVSYDVGLMYLFKKNPGMPLPGEILDRSSRSQSETVSAVNRTLADLTRYDPRGFASLFSLNRFRREWKSYVEANYGQADSKS